MSAASNFVNLAGQRFGRWLVLSYVGQRSEKSYWNCRCDCGTERAVYSASLTRNLSVSCGCFRRQRSSESRTTHGALKNGSETRAHQSWRNMMERCNRPKNNRYKHYGARGIEVCERWLSFPAFLADMGERPAGFTLERKDTNKGYSPDNCIWATWQDQQNNRRNNHLLTVGGRCLTVAEWARQTGIRATAIYARIYNGWSAERAVSEPTHNRGQQQ